MDYIAPQAWPNLAGVNRAGQLFIAYFRELTHPLTVDTYRVRYLNVRLAFRELGETIAAFQTTGIDAVNVRDVAAEAKRLLEEDPVTASLIPDCNFFYRILVAPFADPKGSQIHPGLEVATRTVFETFEQRYSETLVSELPAAIERDAAERTKQLTAAFATDMLGRGYDIRHLHSLGDILLRPPASPFIDKIASFLRRIYPPEPRQFRVFFRLDFLRRMRPFPGSVAGLALRASLEELGLGPREATLLPEGQNPRYAGVDGVQALDKFGALNRALATLSRSLDLLHLAEPAVHVTIHREALVINGDQTEVVPIENQILGPPRLAGRRLPLLDTMFAAVHGGAHLGEHTRARISSGLRYLRMGLTDDTSEGQFLNLWIGLEPLFTRPGRSSIDVIRQSVPRILTYRYLADLLRDLRQNLKRVRVSGILEEPLRTNIFIQPDKLAQLVSLWEILRDNALRVRLLAATDSPLLQARVEEVSSLVGNPQSVLRVISRHQTDVGWHLQRMYRTRNRIVHEGANVLDLTLLSSNLASYLWTSLEELLSQLSRFQALRTVEDVLSKVDTTLARIEESLRPGQGRELPLGCMLDPDLFWP